MDSAATILERYGARLTLFGNGTAAGSPLLAGDDRPAMPDNVTSLNVARTTRATARLSRLGARTGHGDDAA